MASDLQHELTRKKRLGQFFSGSPLARLLATIARAETATSVIDPMCGDGDMLEACRQLCPSTQSMLAGIEIDPRAHQAARARLDPEQSNIVHILLGDCFRMGTLAKLPGLRYKLVITNPAYVRYQTLAQAQNGDLCLPSASEIRSSLLATLDLFPSLDEEDRQLFRELISSYSGLSDAAVPAWILCATLTDLGGKLAMVVPEAWLSRDYAKVIHYILLRWFRILYIVEDSNAVWFPDALVKTTLLVAERVERRDSAFAWGEETFLLAHVPGKAMTADSVVGALFPGTKNPERRFAQLLEHAAHQPTPSKGPIACERIPLKLKAANLLGSSRRARWLAQVEPAPWTHGPTSVSQCEIPGPLASWLGKSVHRFNSLDELGANISQGLRTGANQFFYVSHIEDAHEAAIVAPHPIFGMDRLQVPKDSILPVLRKQSELGETFRLVAHKVSGRVLALQNYALPEDISDELALPGFSPSPMPGPLAQFVRTAATINVGSSDAPEHIPQLTAVRTNVRTSPPRFWYMLPGFAPRHRPDLFLARVNYNHPVTYLNAPQRVLIDANFSTLWLGPKSAPTKHALLAMLNSSWCMAAMELMGSVMGGGALKLEATHLRRLPIPAMSAEAWKALDKMGDKLIRASESAGTLAEIDRTIASEIFSGRGVAKKLAALASIREDLLSKRKHK
jgi:hypothetical protein